MTQGEHFSVAIYRRPSQIPTLFSQLLKNTPGGMPLFGGLLFVLLQPLRNHFWKRPLADLGRRLTPGLGPRVIDGFVNRFSAVMPLPGYLPPRLVMDKIIPPDNLFLVHRQDSPLPLRHKMFHGDFATRGRL
jgi:hypothetical protein